MPHVRSVSIGVWLTRGSRHETARAHRHRPLRRAHALQGHDDALGRGHRPADRLHRRPARRLHVEGIRRLLRQGARRAPAARAGHPADLVPQPAFAADDIAREKQVVLEEIKMVEDTPDDLVHELFAEQFWPAHPLGRPILGTPDTVGALDQPTLRRLLRRHLRRGELRRRRRRQYRARPVRELVERAFGDAPASRPRRRAEPPPSPPRRSQIRDKELEQSHVCLGTPALPQNHPDRYAAYALNTVLGGSMSSRLFQNVREKRGLGLRGVLAASAPTATPGRSASTPAAPTKRSPTDRRRRRRNAASSVRAAPRRRAASRQGSPEGQPDAQSREHVEPHVAPGAAGDLRRDRPDRSTRCWPHRGGRPPRTSHRLARSSFPRPAAWA